MTENDCQKIRLSAMAIQDGQISSLPPDEIERHVDHCPECREEVVQMKAFIDLLDGQKRQTEAEDLWPQIASAVTIEQARINDQKPSPVLLGLLILFLLIYRLIDHTFPLALLVQIASVTLGVAIFWRMGSNPFRINPYLQKGS